MTTNPLLAGSISKKTQEDEEQEKYFNFIIRRVTHKMHKFFRRFVNSVEIDKEGVLTKNYF